MTVVRPTLGTVRALGRDLGTEQMGILLAEERHPTSMSEHVADYKRVKQVTDGVC